MRRRWVSLRPGRPVLAAPADTAGVYLYKREKGAQSWLGAEISQRCRWRHLPCNPPCRPGRSGFPDLVFEHEIPKYYMDPQWQRGNNIRRTLRRSGDQYFETLDHRLTLFEIPIR